eukprot:TRINITY_DN57188_c0_g1_i1.p1 TRINITY_DN57188_c0_g1~~TRINITY_DN57188_c0_g1_i1.p1  ORF type:complete len:353 (-),score=45.77 TRINITY_DN57188_c0_g1_i1:141-1199(-)
MEVLGSSQKFQPAMGQDWPVVSGLLAASLTTFALGMWFVELARRSGYIQPWNSLNDKGNLLRRYAPEALGLAAFACFAMVRLVRRGHSGFDTIPADQMDIWQDIDSKWPMLVTADSLFVLQAMVRIVVLLSVACRGPASAPLSGSPACFGLLAQVCRLLLFVFSPLGVYHIDGPLGGVTSIALEAACVPVLLFLCRGLTIRGAAAVAAGAACAAWIAGLNRFGLADDLAYLDTLFSLVQVLDFCSACSFLVRSLGDLIGRKTTFHMVSPVHALLPLQALMPAYFFLTAFAQPLEAPVELVRNGRPFEMMWFVGATQVGIYGLVGALQLAWSLDVAPEEPAAECVALLECVDV